MIYRLFPFLNWGSVTNGKTLKADFIAGLTVALVLIPQSMAYASLAGLPAIYGLYAALLPGLIGALWGSCSHLGTGPVAMTSLLTMVTLIPFAAGDPDFVGSERYVELAITLAFLVGVVRLLVGFCKLTFLVNFLSQPVVGGFTTAGALIIASSQVGKLFGVQMHRGSIYLLDIWDLILRIPSEIHLPTFIIGLVSIVMLWALKKYTPKIPSALVVVGLGSIVVWFFDLADPAVVSNAAADSTKQYVSVIGQIPAGLPSLHAPVLELATIIQMIPGALVVMFIGFMEVTAVTKSIAPKSKEKISLDQELIGQGLSAVAGSFTSCYPTSGSFSRTALNYFSGGKTGLSGVFVGLFVLITLLFFTPYLMFLPNCVLAALIIMAVVGLMDFKAFGQAWRIHKSDGISAIGTFAASILFAPNIVNGIIFGGILALSLHLYRTMKPTVEIKAGLKEEESTIDANDALFPTIQFSGRIYFANTQHFEQSVLNVLELYPKAEKIILLAEGIHGVDASGAIALRELIGNLRDLGKELVFVGLSAEVKEVLQRAGLIEVIGDQNIFTDSGKLGLAFPTIC